MFAVFSGSLRRSRSEMAPSCCTRFAAIF